MRSFRSIILTIVLFVGIVWWQSFDTKRKSDDSIEMAIVVLKSVPEYDENKDFFNAKLAEFHERAFGMAHKRGRFESSFGETIYRTVLLKQFMNDAEAAGNTPVVEAMQRELQKIEQSTSDH